MTSASQETAVDKTQGNSYNATQHMPATPTRANIDTSRTSIQTANETFFTAQDNSTLSSPENVQSVHKMCYGARNSSLTTSTSANAVCTSFPAPSTPTRGPSDLSVNTSVTPYLDHVLSYHQKVSPTTFSPDRFTSFTLDSDTPGSHDSGYSYFGNWRFYARVGETSGGDEPPSSSDDLSVSDNDSSDQGHQVILLPRPYSSSMAIRSVPFLFNDNTTVSLAPEAQVDSPARSRSLSALPGHVFNSGNAPTSTMTRSERDHSLAFHMNSSQEAMRFACCSPDIHEANTTVSSTSAYDLVGRLDSSAQNEMRGTLRSKMVVKPLKQLRKVVNKLLA